MLLLRIKTYSTATVIASPRVTNIHRVSRGTSTTTTGGSANKIHIVACRRETMTSEAIDDGRMRMNAQHPNQLRSC